MNRSRLASIAVLFLVPACSRACDGGGGHRVRIAVSVDWEGAYLDKEGLSAMAGLRKALDGVPLTHFLSAGYFTKPGIEPEEVAAQIHAAVLSGDETGLHIHAWQSLAKSAGVSPRKEPTFFGKPLMTFEDGDWGFEVELGGYQPEEIAAIVRRSKALLDGAGFSTSPTFRAGGWLATPRVLEAVRKEGFLYDSSATDPSWIREASEALLVTRISETWPAITRTTQPFWIDTPSGRVLEMPDTGNLADYTTTEEMSAHLQDAIARFKREPDKDVYIQVGFHQETAKQFSARLIPVLEPLLREKNPAVVFETVEASARRFMGR